MNEDEKQRSKLREITSSMATPQDGIVMPDGSCVEEERTIDLLVMLQRDKWSDKPKPATLRTTLILKTVYRNNLPSERDGIVRLCITERSSRCFDIAYDDMRKVAQAICETSWLVLTGQAKTRRGATTSIVLPLTSNLKVSLTSPGTHWLGEDPVVLELGIVVANKTYQVCNPVNLYQSFFQLFNTPAYSLLEDAELFLRMFETHNTQRGQLGHEPD